MSTAKERSDISNLQTDVGDLKTDVAVMKTDMKYVKKSAAKMETFIDQNTGGIKLSTLLNEKVVSVVVTGIVAAALYFTAKGGGL